MKGSHEAERSTKREHNWHDGQCEHSSPKPRWRALTHCTITFAIDRLLRTQLDSFL